jgi:hypothetical protein
MQKYRRLWNHFLATEAVGFENERKLTIKEIKRIGVRKFIKANDWRGVDDVKKWRTDVVEVIPCPHCKQNFGIMDDTLGLCPVCLGKFNLNSFYRDVYAACGEDPVRIGKSLALFMVDKNLRKQYYTGSNKETKQTKTN